MSGPKRQAGVGRQGPQANQLDGLNQKTERRRVSERVLGVSGYAVESSIINSIRSSRTENPWRSYLLITSILALDSISRGL